MAKPRCRSADPVNRPLSAKEQALRMRSYQNSQQLEEEKDKSLSGSESEEEEPRKRSSKRRRKKRTSRGASSGEEEEESSGGEETFLPTSFVQNKNLQRMKNHPNAENMPPRRRSQANPANKSSGTGSRNGQDGVQDPAAPQPNPAAAEELRKLQLEIHRLKMEKKAQNNANGYRRNKRASKGNSASAIDSLIESTTKTYLFKFCKFLSTPEHLKIATKKVMREMELREWEEIDDDMKRIQFEEEWVAKNQDTVCNTLNVWRNYVQGELLKLLFKEMIPAGRLEEIPTPKQILDLALRNGMDGDTDQAQRNRIMMMWYWDEAIPKVADHCHWGHGKRHHLLLSTAKQDPGNPDSQYYVSPSDEAFLVLLWENCHDRWMYEYEQQDSVSDREDGALDSEDGATKKKGKKRKKPEGEAEADGNANGADPKADDDETVDPRSVSPYTITKGGAQKFGGWNKAGRKRYRELLNLIVEARAQPHVLAVETRVLQMVRDKHDCDDCETKQKSKKKKTDVDDIDSDHDPDWL